MSEKFVIVQHENLTDDCLDEIARLKQQHWQYPAESQKKWIQSNLRPNDIHLLMKIDNQYVAYLSISIINMLIDGQDMLGKGLGNVCVDKAYQGQGLGKKIVEKASEIIKAAGDTGILLCRRHLMPFYERCGWSKIRYGTAEVDGKGFDEVVMMFNSDLEHITNMSLDRNF